MSYFPFLHFFAFLVYLYLGAYIIVSNPRSSLNRVCATIFAGYSIWSLGMMFIHNPGVSAKTAVLFENIAVLGWATFPSLLLWFALIFAGKKRLLKLKMFYPIIFVIPLFFIYKQWTGFLVVGYIKESYGWSGIWSGSIWPYFYYAYYSAVVGTILYLMFDFWRKTENIAKKKEAAIIFVATLIALVLGSLTDVILPRLGIRNIPDVTPVIVLIWAFGLVYAIAKYKFLAITPATAAQDIISSMTDALILVDQSGDIVTVNKAGLELLKYSKRELLGRPVEKILTESSRSIGLPDKIANGKDVKSLELALNPKNAKEVPVIFSSSILWGEGATVAGAVCIATDITERKKAEEQLHKTHSALEERVKERTQDLVLANEQLEKEVIDRKRAEQTLRESEAKYSTLVERGNDAIIIVQDDVVKFANYKMTEFIDFSIDKVVGRPFVDFIVPEYRKTVFEIYKKRLSNMKAPTRYEIEVLTREGGKIPVEINASIIDYQGRPANMAIIRDITERKRTEEELKESCKKLEGVVEKIVYVMARIVETKDLYTAGHQKRVAELACAIAREMGLSEDKVKGIHMASVIHDIGKISIPGEILSKPSHLSEVEFNMVKTHAQMGHDILKTIDFPWPVAQIVLQHHERMDGSGYPEGLKGKKILIEAEILSVADVVEAMISHRPYRPALGPDEALSEIKKKRGILYYPEAVDACLKLFEEKRFKFE